MIARSARWWSRHAADEEGGATLFLGPFLVWMLLIGSIVIIDLSAYFVAAARAQNTADAAALAAVSADATLAPGRGVPDREARIVTEQAGAELEECFCAPASGRAVVTVSVEVGGLVVPQVQGMRRIAARASAELAPPDPDDPRRSHLPPRPPPPAPPPSSGGAW